MQGSNQSPSKLVWVPARRRCRWREPQQHSGRGRSPETGKGAPVSGLGSATKRHPAGPRHACHHTHRQRSTPGCGSQAIGSSLSSITPPRRSRRQSCSLRSPTRRHCLHRCAAARAPSQPSLQMSRVSAHSPPLGTSCQSQTHCSALVHAATRPGGQAASGMHLKMAPTRTDHHAYSHAAASSAGLGV